MILLQAQQVARRFGGEYLFKNASLDVQEHARLALVGPNGVGKSTFLKIIAGINPPDEGQIVRAKNLTVGYLAQDSGLDSASTIYAEMLTVFDDLRKMETQMHDLEQAISNSTDQSSEAYRDLLKQYDRIQHDFSEQNGYGYEAEIRNVLHGFQFYRDTYDMPINQLSGGERSRLALARLLLERRQLIILDEPTNHLDIETLSWLETYLKGYPGSILVVSHDRYFLDHVVNEVYELSDNGTQHYHGNYSKFLIEKQNRLDQEWKAYERQQAEIQKMQTFIDKNIVRASTTKQAQSRRKQLEKMDRLAPPKHDHEIHFEFTADHKSGNEVLQLVNGTVGYESDQPMIKNINLNVNKGDVQAIIGPNGIGKSTLLKSLLGQIPLLGGDEKIGANVEIGYYDQEQDILHKNKTVLAEIWDDHPTMPEKDIRSILGSFLFRGEDVQKSVAQLSGGEKARLSLTKLALQHDNFLILDEPTNHLDIDSKEVLEQALLNFDGTILFVSHDRYFINKVATSIVEVAPEGGKFYMGDYEYYLEKKADEAAQAEEKAKEATPEAKTISTAKQSYQASKEDQRQLRKLKREIDDLENQMTDLENLVQEIQERMTQPEVYSDPEKSRTEQTNLDEANARLEKIETQWEEKGIALEDLEQK